MGQLSQKRQAFTEQYIRESAYAAVLEVLKKYGLEKLTVQRVAAAAGIGTGTLYNYFKDKDALLVYTAVRLFDQIRHHQREAVGAAKTPAKKLYALLEATFTFFSRNIAYFRFLDQAQVYCKIDMAVKHDHVNREKVLMSSIIQKGAEDGLFKAVNPKKAADFFQRAMIGTLCMVPELGDFDPQREAASLLKMFRVYLSPSNG